MRGPLAVSTAVISAASSTGWGSSRSTRSTCSCAARSCHCSPGSGPHPRSLIADATAAHELFEFNVHEACHVPVELHPNLRWYMARGPSLGGGRPDPARPAASHRRRAGAGPRRGPTRRQRPPAAGRAEGAVVGLGRRQDRARTSPARRRAHRGAPAVRLRPPLRPHRTGDPRARPGDAGPRRARRAQEPAGTRGAPSRHRHRGGPRRLPPAEGGPVPPADRRARRGGPVDPDDGRGLDEAGVPASPCCASAARVGAGAAQPVRSRGVVP